MFNSQVLEIGIGLAFVFLVASLLATAVREMIEGLLKTRAIHLERGIRQLLDDPTGTLATKSLFDHPQLYGLFDGVYDPTKLVPFLRKNPLSTRRRQTQVQQNGFVIKEEAKRLPLLSRFPAYIPSRNFAIALLDLVGAGGGDQRASDSQLMETLRANAMTLRPGKVRDAILVALAEGGNDFDRARKSLEAWFDAGMDRVSGWYKRESQLVLILIGLVTAVGFNIDAVRIASTLASNNSVRQQILLRAEDQRHALNPGRPTPPDQKDIEDAKASLGTLIGWGTQPDPAAGGKAARDASEDGVGRIALMVAGWLLTAIAVSLGAPFWFDVLNKFMVIRATVKPYEKSPPEGSEDRRGGKPVAEQLDETAPRAAAPPAPEQPGREGPPLGHVRLAVGVDQLQSPELFVNGKPEPLPVDGLIEIPLEMGVPHTVQVTSRNALGLRRRYEKTITLSFDNDLAPVALP
ncbi:hypothetical protein [Sphingomonas sp. BK580]|uniref:hypothetical protein n=1 Tax=Sphingomonas sp. BK580 TaxID=2586972 RepID=UPI0016113F1F|nr:hypothetical protein [Sphingomonas sp. BK580]MBB3693566.1 hypothetical protein [Sphingomonas sp. BK580]